MTPVSCWRGKKRASASVWCDGEMSYDEERLGDLLRLLPPAPEGWVQAAQELPAARAALDGLVARAEADVELRRRILADLEAAFASEGVVANAALLAELRARLSPE
jgi:hypothetical protein